jgi:L-aspartate oxidase
MKEREGRISIFRSSLLDPPISFHLSSHKSSLCAVDSPLLQFEVVEKTDYIIIGSGIAGLRAGLELAKQGRVVVLTKDRVTESNTEYAQGGVAVVMSDDDQISLHYDDTIKAGVGLCDPDAVRVLVEDGPKYINELIRWGADFDRVGGRLQLGHEAAHSRRRIVHAQGDSTGREIVRAMLSRLRSLDGVQLIQHALTIDLLTEAGRCVGVGYVDTTTGRYHPVLARAVILASGGVGQIYAQTTNPDVATGDGLAMAYRAGAVLCDMEFVQFHPTALKLPGAPRFLLSEAMRGEGAKLRDARGELFMSGYDERAELAPRDVATRAIVSQMRRTETDTVYLDMTHLDSSHLKVRFPRIYNTCLQYGIDLTRELIPVGPAAHYMMGGVRTDLDGRTTVAGLYAAGEVACAGIHGANRLASNSLLEGLVFGARAGKAALAEAGARPKMQSRPKEAQPVCDWRIQADVFQKVRSVMWERVGIIRTGSNLQAALDILKECQDRAANQATKNFVIVATLVARAALFRRESRGAQFRRDFPERDDLQWLVHSAQCAGEEPYKIPVGEF